MPSLELVLVLVGQLRWANTMCGVAWRGVEKSRWATIAASWPHLHCSVHCPRVSLSGTQGRLSFSAGSSADDGSPGEGLGIVGEKMCSLARTGRGTAPRRRSQVAGRRSHVSSRGLRRKVGNSAGTFSMIRQSHHHHDERVSA